MNEDKKLELIATSWKMHADVENAYLANPASQADENWHDKQRILLADMALHLLQTALSPGEISQEKLRNNLNAILTISDHFLPDAELKSATEKLY